MTKKRITIKDLARELNISTSTVSRALADQWDVNPETRKTVLELAQKLGYKPNLLSKHLKSQQSMTIGVVIPEFITAFFPEVIIGIEQVLSSKDYLTTISQSNESQENEIANIIALENKMVDGFIISLCKDAEDVSFFNELIQRNVPTVFFNRTLPEIDAPSVVINDRKWAKIATQHLIDQDCKRIVHICGSENLAVASERKKGYLDALNENNIPIDEKLIIKSGVIIDKGVLAAKEILQLPVLPDGIFAFNDPVAIGAMKTLQKAGLKIPEDIAIVGFSDSQLATVVEPNLTSVEQPTVEMGRQTAQLLLDIIKGNNLNRSKTLKQNIVLDARLNIRDSSLRNTKL